VFGEGAEETDEAEVLPAGMVAGRVIGDLPSLGEVHAELAEVRHPLRARAASAADGQEAEDHPVPGGEVGDIGPHLLDDARTLVPADDG
jgi:hypothetical protein